MLFAIFIAPLLILFAVTIVWVIFQGIAVLFVSPLALLSPEPKPEDQTKS